ncbi:electron transport complex subunit RsxD [Kangiella sp. TOML190]|uniref:electron transport complex subunit RsxD n=1 Tax=Kangiella sp. TOML190 TaxID=2931351 RepID=UPI00203F648E|nr:electron transport complex subunit RsxD [Kangiella sp. TOML190]
MNILSSPFDKKPNSVIELMLWVIGATLPGLLVLVYFFGIGVIVNVIIASITALACEALILKLRNRPVLPILFDGSALLTAWLIGLALPPLLPWWMTVVGTAFAIIFAKHVYGGLGNNLFNPAMVAYVLLLISFPVQMTAWLPPVELAQNPVGVADTFAYIFTGANLSGQDLNYARLGVDGFTMATPLDHVKTELSQGFRIAEINQNPMLAGFSGVGWFWVNLAFLVGGLVLMIRKVIGWQLPAGALLGIFLTSFLFYGIDTDHYLSPLFHTFAGATMLGAFFIATDPVTASTTPKGRWIFGFGIGAITIIIRTFGGYPDAIAFAVLIMNMAVPMIDYYTRPKVYGHNKINSANKSEAKHAE